MKLANLVKARSSGFSGTIGILAVLNLVLAFAALFKDILMAAYLGTTGEADALLLSYSINDILGNNLYASAVGASCIPLFASYYRNHEDEEFGSVVKSISAFGFLISVILLIIMFFFRDGIIEVFGRGLSDDVYPLSMVLFIIILPTIIIYPMVSIGTSALQVAGRFTAPAVAPILFNIIFLIPLLSGYIMKIPARTGAYLTGIFITIGAAVMALVVWIPLWKLRIGIPGLQLRSGTSKSGGLGIRGFGKVLELFIPYLLILFSTQSVLYVERYIASGMGEGSISALNYAYRLSQFPVWVFTAAIGTVVYPSMARLIKEGSSEELKGVIYKSISGVLLITVPMCMFLLVFRVPVISVLFTRGAFDANSLYATSEILSGYCIAIVGQSLAAICLKVLLSAGKIRLTLISYLISFSINIFLDFYLAPKLGLKAIGYGAAVGAVLNGIFTALIVKSRFKISFQPRNGRLLKAVFANILVLCILLILINIWYIIPGSAGFIMQAAFTGLSAVFCFLVYGFIIQRAGLV